MTVGSWSGSRMTVILLAQSGHADAHTKQAQSLLTRWFLSWWWSTWQNCTT